jgi:hypothetical protein
MTEPDRPQMEAWRRVACWINKAALAKAHASARVPTSIHARTHTHALADIHRNIVFYGNNGFVNAPQCYFLRTFPLFLRILYEVNKSLKWRPHPSVRPSVFRIQYRRLNCLSDLNVILYSPL